MESASSLWAKASRAVPRGTCLCRSHHAAEACQITALRGFVFAFAFAFCISALSHEKNTTHSSY
eukprot:6328120-Prorocentrum_lima.AAC.1